MGTEYVQPRVSEISSAADIRGGCVIATQRAGCPGRLPGTVNYVEGQASIDGNPLNTRQDGNTQIQPNQSLMTANGKAEMLLSPGVFVRAGSNSEIRLVSNGLVDPS